MGRRWTPEEDALLGTVTDAALAIRLGRTESAVLQRRQKLAASSAPTEQRGCTELTQAQIDEIRQRWSETDKPHGFQTEVAREYGVHQSTISRVLRGSRRHRRDVPGAPPRTRR